MKRIVSLLLCLVMAASMMPVGAFAQEADSGCTCTTKCTQENVNAACPVCSPAGADLTACRGEGEPKCLCTTLCTEDSINENCPLCAAEGADLDQTCTGAALAAFAAAPRALGYTLYVGDTLITDSGYWTTNEDGKLTASDANNYHVSFDAGTNTLTLNNAIIKGSSISGVMEGGYAGIVASSSSSDVS